MINLLAEIWLCLSVTALMGVLAGWLVWGRRTKRIVASYRGRLARLRANWEAVEEQLAEALKLASALERERDQKHVELELSQNDFERTFRENEEAWRDERRFLEDGLRELSDRIVALEQGSGLPAQSRVTDALPQSRPRKAFPRPP